MSLATPRMEAYNPHHHHYHQQSLDVDVNRMFDQYLYKVREESLLVPLLFFFLIHGILGALLYSVFLLISPYLVDLWDSQREKKRCRCVCVNLDQPVIN